MAPSSSTRRSAIRVLLLALLSLPVAAQAAGGGAPAAGARAAALAEAVTARAGGAEALAANPASMAALDAATLSVSALAGRVSLTFARHGEPAEDLGRDVSGFTLAFGAPLPGPAWLRAVRLGGVAYLPAAHLLRIRAAERVDVPQAPLYGDRLDHVAATLGGALSLGGWGGLGVGVTLTPDLEAPTKVRYDAGRGDTPEDHVVLHVDRELAMRAALTAGVRITPSAGWALGAAWQSLSVLVQLRLAGLLLSAELSPAPR